MAISIPIFTAQLEKAREATDAANIRSAYAEMMADALTDETVSNRTVSLKQKTADWQNAPELPANLTETNVPTASGTATLAYVAPTATADAYISVTYS